MKKYNVTVNGVTYEVLVEEAGVVSAPAAYCWLNGPRNLMQTLLKN